MLDVMRSGQFAQGGCVRTFERAFASATGAEFAVATSSGTAALFLALLAHGVGRGDEVITSPLTFIATATAIVHAGAVPVFADVDDTLGLSAASVAGLIGPRTRAVVPVVGGRRLGCHGTAVYSFYATKNLTTGEGGMVTTNDPQVADLCAALRHQSYAGPAYVHDRVGFNFRMTELQAAIGLVQVGRLAAITERRRSIASYYDETVVAEHFARPATLPDACHVYHQYTLRLPADNDGARQERDRIRASLAQVGVATGVYYPVPVHRQPAYEPYSAIRCPNSEQASDDMFSIPVHHSLSEAEVETVAQAVAAL